MKQNNLVLSQSEEQITCYKHQDNSYCLVNMDVMDGLRSLPDDHFNVAITSPPYYWVRDYEVDGQIGHEDSVDGYVDTLVNVFNEVKRVLHPKGIFFLNIGDTYYSGNGQPHGCDPKCASRNFMRRKLRPVDQSGWNIPKKSLIGVPWKIAFALQQEGWTLRSDIIWRRKNAFSEPSAKDRPKRQYEHVFMFTKSRFYNFNPNALDGDGDVWDIPIQRKKAMDHNAPFPVELVQRCISMANAPGGNVLDPFVGSGTTMLASLQLKCNCVGIDIKDAYVNELQNILIETGCIQDAIPHWFARI